MDPSAYDFHSLRAGHVTQARRNGASIEEIYDREFNPAARNSVTSLGL
ncbi:hypothetical protein ACWD3Z_00630 [Streptomyces sp. NPDC002740]